MDYLEDQKVISTQTLDQFHMEIVAHRSRYGWYLDWLEDYLKPEYNYLDLGCRNGEFLVALHDRTGALDFTGVELHEESAMQASGQRVGIAVTQQDVHEINLETGAYDFVFLTHLLEHCHNPARVLWQAERVTRLGGYMFIEIPLEPKPESIPTKWGHWHTFQYPEELLELLDGMKILKQETQPVKENWFRVLVEV